MHTLSGTHSPPNTLFRYNESHIHNPTTLGIVHTHRNSGSHARVPCPTTSTLARCPRDTQHTHHAQHNTIPQTHTAARAIPWPCSVVYTHSTTTAFTHSPADTQPCTDTPVVSQTHGHIRTTTLTQQHHDTLCSHFPGHSIIATLILTLHRHDPVDAHHLRHALRLITPISVPAPATQRYTITLTQPRTPYRTTLTQSHTPQPDAATSLMGQHPTPSTRHSLTNLQRTLQHTRSHTTPSLVPVRCVCHGILGEGMLSGLVCVCLCALRVLMPPPLGPSPGGGAERQPLLPGKLPRPPQRGH